LEKNTRLANTGIADENNLPRRIGGRGSLGHGNEMVFKGFCVWLQL
jgi:hypothetical protein